MKMITTETAIALLNNLRAFSEDDDEPAIDMAIEELSKPKTMTIEDLVAIAEKYGMYLSISLTPINEEDEE